MTYSKSVFHFTHLLQEVLGRLEQTKNLKATGGSTTTIVDTTINSSYLDDSFKNYTAFIARDAGGAGAAPEGEFQRVDMYTASSFTLRVDTAFTVAPAAGDSITIARGSLYPIQDVIRICNQELQKFGAVRQVDSSLTTAANQTEYTIPIAVKGKIYKVEVQSLDDSDDNRPKPIDYEIVPAASGSTDTLRIRQPDTGWTIYLYYEGPQADLYAYDGVISEYINRGAAVAACALAVAEWKSNINPDPLPKLRKDLAEARVLHPVPNKPKRVNGFIHWSDPDLNTPGDRTPR
jgi:hypothetical protein